MIIKNFQDPYYQEMFDEKAGKYLEIMELEEAIRVAYNETLQKIKEDL